jgi:hypothetical protein
MNQVVVGTAMNQEKPKRVKQVFYNGRWVDKEFFRAFVYSTTEQKLAQSYKEYEDLIATGLWFDNRTMAIDAKKLAESPKAEILELKQPKARKPKNGANS